MLSFKLDSKDLNIGGKRLTVHRLGTEHADWINSNWKFRDDYSLHWIKKQCQSGFAYGVSYQGQLISWIVAYM